MVNRKENILPDWCTMNRIFLIVDFKKLIGHHFSFRSMRQSESQNYTSSVWKSMGLDLRDHRGEIHCTLLLVERSTDHQDKHWKLTWRQSLLFRLFKGKLLRRSLSMISWERLSLPRKHLKKISWLKYFLNLNKIKIYLEKQIRTKFLQLVNDVFYFSFFSFYWVFEFYV